MCVRLGICGVLMVLGLGCATSDVRRTTLASALDHSGVKVSASVYVSHTKCPTRMDTATFFRVMFGWCEPVRMFQVYAKQMRDPKTFGDPAKRYLVWRRGCSAGAWKRAGSLGANFRNPEVWQLQERVGEEEICEVQISLDAPNPVPKQPGRTLWTGRIP